MALKYPSLIAYMAAEQGDVFDAALEDFIRNTLTREYFRSKLIEEPRFFQLEPLAFTRTLYYKTPGDLQEFKTVIRSRIIVSGDQLPYKDTRDMLFTVTARCVLKDGVHDVTVTSIEVGDRAEEFDKSRHLSKYLNPYISKDGYEAAAEEFLRAYYPEALDRICPVKPDAIIERMGLEMRLAPMGKKYSGKSYFAPAHVTVYDGNNEQAEADVKPGTILVNADMFFERGMGWLANTKTHESVHFHFHSKFFELMKVLSPDDVCFACEDMVGDDDEIFPDLAKMGMVKNRYYMEKQANGISPKVLMPKHGVPKVYAASLALARRGRRGKVTVRDYSVAVHKVADYYGVSFTCARYRLVELGFTEVSGLHCAVNGEKIESYRCDRSDIKENEKYLLDYHTATRALSTDEKLRSLVVEGRISYVDGMFVINDPRFVKRYKRKAPTLTKYARNHVSECAFLFTVEVEGVFVDVSSEYLNGGAANKSDGDSSYEFSSKISFLDRDNMVVSETAMGSKPIGSLIDAANAVVMRMRTCRSFGEQLAVVMSATEIGGPWSEAKLAQNSGLSASSIRDYKNNVTNPPLKSVLAMIAGMKLYPKISIELLSSAGYDLTRSLDANADHYFFLVTAMYGAGLANWNRYLESEHCEETLPK